MDALTRRAVVAALAAIVLGVTAVAGADSLALTRDGSLYRVTVGDAGIVLGWTAPDGAVTESVVPQTAGAMVTSLQVAVDEPTGSAFVAWQEGADDEATVNLAVLASGTWSGPLLLAGADGTLAGKPQLLADRVVSTVTDDDGEWTVSTGLVHVAWWSWVDLLEDGTARLMSIPLDDQGLPDLDAAQSSTLADLLPYGVGCQGLSGERLAQPRLFMDPETGDPHVMATDFSNCSLAVVQLDEDIIDWDPVAKRGRHAVVFGRSEMMAVNPDIVFASAHVEVGHDLSVVLWWDGDDAVHYLRLAQDEVAEVQTLPLGSDLDHEQAVILIRSLTH